MALLGKRKAALLLMNLDVAVGAQLLERFDAEMVHEIALELAYMDSEQVGEVQEESEMAARDFQKDLEAGKGFHLRTFTAKLLEATVGKEKAGEFQEQIKRATKERDPFIAVRLAEVNDLVFVLKKHPPQVAAAVLSELPPTKSRAILELLDKDLQIGAVWSMTRLAQESSVYLRRKVAEIITEDLKQIEKNILPQRENTALRKLALVMGSIESNRREEMLNNINSRDEDMFAKITSLMVTWEDVPSIAGRELQVLLRSLSTKILATVLYDADKEITQNIRSNISERVCAQLDEEISLMQAPMDDEIHQAREQIMEPLRELSAKGKLRFATSMA